MQKLYVSELLNFNTNVRPDIMKQIELMANELFTDKRTKKEFGDHVFEVLNKYDFTFEEMLINGHSLAQELHAMLPYISEDEDMMARYNMGKFLWDRYNDYSMKKGYISSAFCTTPDRLGYIRC